MKRKVSTLPAFVLVLVLMVSIFAGCGTQKVAQTTATATTAAVTAAQATEPALNEVTLKFFFGGDKPSAADEVWTALSEKFKDQLNAKFEIGFIGWADYKDKLSVMSASGDNWDGNFDGDWLAFPALSAAGTYKALNDLLPKYAPVLYEKYQQTGVLNAATSNGNIIAMPWTMAQNTRPVLRYRADLVKKANINVTKDSIKTIEDYDKFLGDLQASYPGMKNVFPNQNDGWGNPVLSLLTVRDEYAVLSHGFVFSMNDPKCTIVPVETLPIYLEASKYSRVWYEKGYIPKDAMVDKTDTNSYWNNGQSIVNVGNHEASNMPKENWWKDASWENDTSLMYPDKKYYNRTPLANVFCINKNAANPERALIFCELMETDKDFYDAVMYGILDKTYVLNGEAADFPAGIDAQTSNYLNWTGQWSWWKPQFMRPTPLYPEGFWVKEGEFAQQMGTVNPLDGLFFNTDNVKNELAKRDQLVAELAKPLSFGVVKDVDKSVADLVSKLKDAGTDAIVADMQKQVDAFLAQKK